MGEVPPNVHELLRFMVRLNPVKSSFKIHGEGQLLGFPDFDSINSNDPPGKVWKVWKVGESDEFSIQQFFGLAPTWAY